MKRVLFVEKYLNILEDENSIMFVIDEMGIGTQPLRYYAYSTVGTPAVLERKKGLLQ